MENSVIRINSGIKKYQILNENDQEVAVLRIDSRDSTVFERFCKAYEGLTRIEKNLKARLKEAGIEDQEKLDPKSAKEYSAIYNDALVEIMDELEVVVGKGVFEEMYADNYELNENFVPSIDSLAEFCEQITPIMQSIFVDQQSNGKYSTGNRGKRTRTRTTKDVK